MALPRFKEFGHGRGGLLPANLAGVLGRDRLHVGNNLLAVGESLCYCRLTSFILLSFEGGELLTKGLNALAQSNNVAHGRWLNEILIQSVELLGDIPDGCASLHSLFGERHGGLKVLKLPREIGECLLGGAIGKASDRTPGLAFTNRDSAVVVNTTKSVSACCHGSSMRVGD